MQRSSLESAAENWTTFLSTYYPIRFQLPFCLWYGDSSNHSFAFIGSPMWEWLNNWNCHMKTSNQLVVLSQSSPIQNLWDKQQQQQAGQANVMHNNDVFITLLGKVLGNRSSIIYKIASFCWISTLESLVFTCKATKWAHPAQEILKNQKPPIPGKSRVGLSDFFF